MRVAIKEYNPEWKAQFEDEKRILLETLSDLKIQVEHIGSTSVNGLGAKPIIDIMIGLENFKSANDQIPKITKLDYEYISKYEKIMPYRRFFTKRQNGRSTHNIHMVEIGTEFWIRHLAFRDHLRRNIRDRDKYYELKKELAQRDWKDTNEYADAKSEFIKMIEGKAILKE